jgi:hypothetical protein
MTQLLLHFAVAGEATPSAPSGIDATTIAAWASLGLSTVLAILAIVIGVLRVVAPRTSATWDDRLLTKLDKLDEILLHVKTAMPMPLTSTTTINVTPAKPDADPAAASGPPSMFAPANEAL